MVKDGKVVRKRPQAIILDILGPFAKKEFHILSKEKKQFYRGNIREYVNDPNSWKRRKGGHLKLFYAWTQKIQSERQLLPNEPKLIDPKTAERVELGKSLVDYILFSIDKNPTDAFTALFLEHMQAWAYYRGSLKTPIYDEVPSVLKNWKELKIQVLLNLNSVQVFERIVSSTNRGNLRGFFSGHAKPDYTKKGSDVFDKCNLVFKIQNPKDALLITHSAKEAAGAHEAGIPVVLIIRPDLDPDFEKRMNEEKKTYKSQVKKVPTMAKGSGIEPYQTAPITDVAPMASSSMIGAGASKVDIAMIESTIADSTRDTREDISSTIKYDDTLTFDVLKSLNDLVFK